MLLSHKLFPWEYIFSPLFIKLQNEKPHLICIYLTPTLSPVPFFYIHFYTHNELNPNVVYRSAACVSPTSLYPWAPCTHFIVPSYHCTHAFFYNQLFFSHCNTCTLYDYPLDPRECPNPLQRDLRFHLAPPAASSYSGLSQSEFQCRWGMDFSFSFSNLIYCLLWRLFFSVIVNNTNDVSWAYCTITCPLYHVKV